MIARLAWRIRQIKPTIQTWWLAYELTMIDRKLARLKSNDKTASNPNGHKCAYFAKNMTSSL